MAFWVKTPPIKYRIKIFICIILHNPGLPCGGGVCLIVSSADGIVAAVMLILFGFYHLISLVEAMSARDNGDLVPIAAT